MALKPSAWHEDLFGSPPPDPSTREYHKSEWMLDVTARMHQSGATFSNIDDWCDFLSETYDAIIAKAYGSIN